MGPKCDSIMFFVGLFELNVDGKNRLSIPHQIRSKMNADQDGRSFYIVLGRRPIVLGIYAERYFERLRSFIPREEQLSDEAHAWRQFELSQGVLVDPDSQGRILIPDRLLKRTGIGREVTLTGAQDHLELWSREEYNKFQESQWSAFDENRARAMDELRNLADSMHPEAPT